MCGCGPQGEVAAPLPGALAASAATEGLREPWPARATSAAPRPWADLANVRHLRRPLPARVDAGAAAAGSARASLIGLGVGRASPLLGAVATATALGCDASPRLDACLGAAALLAAASIPTDPLEAARHALSVCDADHCPLGADAFDARLQRACDLGDAALCAALADALDPGPLLPTDAARAERVRARACDLGDAGACILLARVVSQGPSADLPAAARLYARACALGEATACDPAAQAYAVSGDLDRAIPLYERACAPTPDGPLQPASCLRLAAAYDRQDPSASGRVAALYAQLEAQSLLRCPHEPRACATLTELARALREGQRLPPDPDRAAGLLHTACELSLSACGPAGCDAATRCLPFTTLYADHYDAPISGHLPPPLQPDPPPPAKPLPPPPKTPPLPPLSVEPPPPLSAPALTTLHRLCDGFHDARACFSLAHLSARGLDPRSSPSSALDRFERACGEDFPVACLIAARLSREGSPLLATADFTPDEPRAHRLDLAACTHGVHALCPPPPDDTPKRGTKKAPKGAPKRPPPRKPAPKR